jgi:hypothetical protein
MKYRIVSAILTFGSFINLTWSKTFETFDWMISAGGYRFENEAKEKHFGVELSYLPTPYYGLVASMDFENEKTTNNIGVEILSNWIIADLLSESKFMNVSYVGQYAFWPFLIPSLEIGGSRTSKNEVGLHTSIFLNLAFLHPYFDYNVYENRIDKKFGIKFKFGYGPWLDPSKW